MANLTSVTLTAGVPTAGTGTVGTIDNVTGTAGTPSTAVLTMQGVASGTAVPVSIASLPSGAVTNAGTFAVQLSGATNNINNVAGTVSLPTGASTSALQTTGNTSLATIATGVQTNAAIASTTSGQTGGLIMGAVTTAAPSYTTAQTNPISLDLSGNVRVNVTNANANGQAVMASSAPVVIASNQTAVPTTSATSTSGGATTSRLIAANSTNATSLKASAGTLYGVQCFNNSATIGYLKFYNKASSPTVGTDATVKVIMIPASSGAAIPFPDQGVAFATGIAYAVTGGIADADTTSVAASAFIINIDYA